MRTIIHLAFPALLLVSLSSCLLTASAQQPVDPASFDKAIRPMLQEYCLKCHSTEKHKGDLDLERFTSLSEVKRHPKIWQTVVEQLTNNEMPPKEKPQPAP